jgi:WD40 repeat protein
MALLDIYTGRQDWVEYLRTHEASDPDEADFDLLMGDAHWRAELAQESLNDLLEEVRLPEFEREARAYRTRAERAYLNGWYEEALADFLEAARRNYPDYSVHRSIACLYLYHLIDLDKSLEYFRKAARYARPSHTGQCAEAHYFAGIVCALEHDLDAALSHLREAVGLNPDLSEAQYHLASLSAFSGDEASALTALEAAIRGKARYFDRVRRDVAFDAVRDEVESLLKKLIEPIRERVEEVRRNARSLDEFVIAPSAEDKIIRLLGDVEEQMSHELNYQTGIRVLDRIGEAERELATIHHRFHKQFEVDPRDYIRSLAFSPDGQSLVTGMLNGGLQTWDVNSALQIQSLRAHLASVTAVAFSPDSLWFASASRDRKIRLWESMGGGEVQSLTGHTSEVRSVAFSPDGQWLLSGGQDRTVRLWRTATGGESQTLFGHHGPVTAALFSRDGRTIISGSWDRAIRLWDFFTGREQLSFEAHTRGVSTLALSHDGKALASGSEDGEVRLWNLSDGSLVTELRTGHRNSITSLAFSPDGKMIAAGSLGRTVTLWQVDSGSLLRRARRTRISYHAVAFSPEGQWLALGSRDLQLWLKDLLTRSQHEAVIEGEARALDARKRLERLSAYTSLKRVS